jgi:uncharacterized protein
LKVFFTGGTGLIGRALIDAFVGRMDKVVCVSRKETRARSLLSAGVEIIEADPMRPGPWQDVAAESDVVINLAGEPLVGRWTSERKKRFRDSRVKVARNVAEAVHGSDRPQILLSASAIGYYGDGGREPLYEDRDSGADFLAGLAHEWEGSSLNVDSPIKRVVLLRTGLIFSADGGALPRMVTPYKFLLGGPLGHPNVYVPWIHIKDFVRAIFFIIENEAISGPVNMVAPDPPTQKELAAALSSVLKRPGRIRVPVFILRAVLGEMADMVLTSSRGVPRVLRANGFDFQFKDLHSGLQDLLD